MQLRFNYAGNAEIAIPNEDCGHLVGITTRFNFYTNVDDKFNFQLNSWGQLQPESPFELDKDLRIKVKGDHSAPYIVNLTWEKGKILFCSGINSKFGFDLDSYHKVQEEK